MKPVAFIQAIGPGAQASMKLTGIPASVMIAEAALESAWGESNLSQTGKNLFGVKADASWTGPTISLPTREFIRGEWVEENAIWRAYSSWADCITDHARFFFDNPRYKPALAQRENAYEFAWQLQDCGYATDPKYAVKLNSIRSEWKLASWDVPPSQLALADWAKGDDA